jgi:putative drug exporter of the RND superfamily
MMTLRSTAGLARASAARPWRVIIAWVLILLIAGAATTQLRTTTDGGEFTNGPESARAQKLIEERLRANEPVIETVIVRSESMTVDDPAFQERVAATTDHLLGLEGIVTGAANYYQARAAGSPMAEGLVSADRQATIIQVELGTDLERATEHAAEYMRAVEQQRVDGFQVVTVGNASATHEIVAIAEEDLRKAETFGLPAALIVLVVVFGALVAAGVPIIVGLMAIGVALGMAAGVSQFFELDFAVINMISMIGLAVGIDYALFIVERFREERRRGIEKLEAIAIAGATASRAVLFSGLTVVLALTGMFLIPMTLFKGLAIGAILAVGVAVTAALTLIPALLSLLGDRINWPRRRKSMLAPASAEARGFWASITRAVMRRPVIGMAVAVLLLVGATVPMIDMQTGQSGLESLPPSNARSGFALLEEHFYVGVLSPVQVVIDGDATDPQVAAGVEALAEALRADGLYGDVSIEVSAGQDLVVVSAPLAVVANSSDAYAAIEALRGEIVPLALAGAPAEVLVTGDTAFLLDFNDMLSTWMPIVFAFVLGLAFILLMVAFRSLVVPVLSIFMNLLSVGAAYGLLVLAFQKGYGEFLGFAHTPVIESWIPVFLFCILFGLSMDYHVFLLSRIRERYDQTGDNDLAVAAGLQVTGKIITGAAMIMVVVFAAFAAGRIVSLQQIGFGLAVSVFLDATIVRSVLVPSAMKLLGERNWYLPRWLSWLPDLRIEAEPEVTRPLGVQPLVTAGDD